MAGLDFSTPCNLVSTDEFGELSASLNTMAENLQQAQSLGYTSVFWSLAYVDWYTDNQPTAEQAFSKLLPRIHPGAIVLLHSTSSTNASILDELLTKWESSGYTFGSLTDLQKSL